MKLVGAYTDFPLYTEVILVQDVSEEGGRAGDVGVVVERHEVVGRETGYSVEFFDMLGNTVAVATVPVDLYRRYGGKLVEGTLDQASKNPGMLAGTNEDPAMIDEWAPCGIEKAADIKELFVPHFYFGCEADDPMNTWAFNTKVNPFGARLKAMFSSDIGHWDVPDMREVVEEAYELVEEGLVTEENFREFVFVNPVTLWTRMNPDFFKGTVVEQAVEELRAEGGA